MAEERMLNDEILLGLIKANSGGGGGGTTDYEDLDNKPQIGGVTLSGNKSLSDLGAQEKLTAGDYINLNNGDIAVNRNLVGDNYDYEIKSTGDYKLTIIKSQGGTVISANTYDYSYGTSTNIDNNFTIAGAYSGGNTWVYTALKDSTTHSVGYTWTKSVDASFEETESFPSEDLSGYKLVIKSEMDTALSGKQDTLTFDDAPTDNSNNPVKSNGIYDALELKQDATDDSLETTDKTIVGAINEHEGDIGTLKSGLTDLTEHVDGDATTYPYADVITISDAVPSNLSDCNVKIEPVQDLHGQSAPWVGGAGKNKLPLTVDVIKAINTSGTWSGNVYSENGATITILTDSDNNVIGIKAEAPNTPSDTVQFNLCYKGTGNNFNDIENTSVTMNGCPTGGSENTYYIQFYKYDGTLQVKDTSRGVTFTPSNIPSDARVRITIKSAIPSGGVIFYPMLRLATETDATFAPYTNICPITGHTEASVQRDGKNLVDLADVTGTSGTVYGATKLLPAGTYYGYFFGEYQAWNHFYQYSLDGVNYTNFPTTDDGYAVADVSSGAYYHEKNKMTIHQPAYIRLGIQKNSSVGDNSVDALLTVDSTYYNVINDYTKTGIYYQKMYEPYAGKTYTILFKDAQGQTITVYGSDLDVKNGTLTVGRATTTVTSLVRNNDNSFYQGLSPAPKPNQSSISQIICDRATTGDRLNINTVFINSSGALRVNTAVACSTGEEAIEYYGGSLTVCYELATPFMVQLTPQQIQLLKGTNTLTASTGDISVIANGVSGAIGAVQEQVNDIAEDVENITPTLVYTSPTTGTYGDKLAGVKTAFNNLSTEKKKTSYIVLGGVTKYAVSNWNDGIFTTSYCDAANSAFKFLSIDLSGTGYAMMERLTVTTSGNVIESRVNTENSNTFELYA